MRGWVLLVIFEIIKYNLLTPECSQVNRNLCDGVVCVCVCVCVCPKLRDQLNGPQQEENRMVWFYLKLVVRRHNTRSLAKFNFVACQFPLLWEIDIFAFVRIIWIFSLHSNPSKQKTRNWSIEMKWSKLNIGRNENCAYMRVQGWDCLSSGQTVVHQHLCVLCHHIFHNYFGCI